MKTFKLTLIATSIVLLAACASAPKEAPEPVPPPTNVTLDEINTAIEHDVQIQNEKGEKMVCRREKKVGSRLARETICMTKTEWKRVSEESQRSTAKTMKQGPIPQGRERL